MGKLTDYEKNYENPFLKQAVEQINNNIQKKYRSATNTGEKAILRAYDDRTGEELGHTSFIRQIEVDEAKFAKLYLSQLTAFFDLKESAMRVFAYFLENLHPGADVVLFIPDKVLEYTKYKTLKPVYKGLGQLIEAEVIARGPSDSIYYINPMVIFNGNRITFAKSYIKKKKKFDNPNQLELFEGNESAPLTPQGE